MKETDTLTNAPTTPVVLGVQGRVRVILVGILLPLFLVGGAWLTTSSWNDLPAEFPSHWSAQGADTFLPPRAIITAWSFGGALLTLTAWGVVVAAARGWRWSSVGRGISAVAVGAVGAASTGLWAQLLPARGITSEEVVALGAGPGVLGVFGGFLAVTVLALLAFPKGIPGP